MHAALTEWESFYVIVGSSAAALTGLMFVVIALGAEARAASSDPDAYRAFASPTVVHFCAVLLLAALLSTPRHTAGSLRTCLLATGVAGLAFSIWVIVQARRQKSYQPVLSDWVWHIVLPLAAYAGVTVAGALVRQSSETALYVVGAAALLLLYIGIHNAWDSAVFMTIQRQKPES